jgi:acyl-CoA thioesterase-1
MTRKLSFRAEREICNAAKLFFMVPAIVFYGIACFNEWSGRFTRPDQYSPVRYQRSGESPTVRFDSPLRRSCVAFPAYRTGRRSSFRTHSINRILQTSALLLIAMFAISCNDKNKPAENQPAVKKEESTKPANVKTILFFGNSLTAGYGLDDVSESFPSLIQDKIDSMHLPYKTINAGVSGETSADGNSRIDWLLKQKIDVFVLELGGNDGLRGISSTETMKNLQSIVDKVKSKYPAAKLVLLGMQIPPNMGKKYSTQFKEIYPQLASKNNMALLPFLLEGVGGVASLNQADGIHPTAAGSKIVAENVWKVLKIALEKEF